MHKLHADHNYVDATDRTVETQEIFDYSIEMMGDQPEVASVPNIWDFTNTEIRGDLQILDELFEAIAPRIESDQKVGFVANEMLTVAITKRYSDRFRNHKHLKFETFTSLERCRRWAISE